MRPLPRRALQALDRFNAARPWDHNAHYHRWLLRQLPRRFGSALDVGSGTGDLARLLATRADHVLGIDSDPAITSRARALTPEPARTSFTVMDARTDLPAGPFDTITCVATLHHLPFTDITEATRATLPGARPHRRLFWRYTLTWRRPS
ncbi:class I SAM-dependent methyltransferase [Streptomyces olivaceus]|uniref:class I SAM-dependent methyltransferase n=1 Tax=Streptomyces olivaceus TaxID=47716 RepID=UPI0033C8907A